jgi:hypothetical protein
VTEEEVNVQAEPKTMRVNFIFLALLEEENDSLSL